MEFRYFREKECLSIADKVQKNQELLDGFRSIYFKIGCRESKSKRIIHPTRLNEKENEVPTRNKHNK